MKDGFWTVDVDADMVRMVFTEMDEDGSDQFTALLPESDAERFIDAVQTNLRFLREGAVKPETRVSFTIRGDDVSSIPTHRILRFLKKKLKLKVTEVEARLV